MISSGTRRSSSRSSTGHASAAERSAMAAWVRARSPKPCAASGPASAQSSEASATWAALSTACTCSTSRTAPATSSSSSASIRNEIDTRCGRSSRPRARIRAMRCWSWSLKSSGRRRRGAGRPAAGSRRGVTGRAWCAARCRRPRRAGPDRALGRGLVEALVGARPRQLGDPALVVRRRARRPASAGPRGRVRSVRRRRAGGRAARRRRAARPTGGGRPGRGPWPAPAARRGSA